MINFWLVFPIIIPLLAGGIQIILRAFLRRREKRNFWQRLTNFIGFSLLLILSIYLFSAVKDGNRYVYIASNWIAPFGIVYVLDSLSALMVLISSILAMAVLIYSCQTNSDKLGENYHPFLAFQFFGINGAFLTGDVFNLFVFFEILLIASYGLLVHGGGAERTRAGLHYVVINLIGSALFLIAVSAIYGVVGTLNLADLAVKIPEIPTDNIAVLASAGILLLIVFGIKAAMFPLYFWLPQSYPQAMAPVAALFAIMTKVGIYSIIRVHGTMFADGAGFLSFFHNRLILILGLITTVIATFGVLAAKGLREKTAYMVLASVATILIGVGIGNPEAMAATIYYLIHSVFISAALFLWVDIISKARGEYDDKMFFTPSFPNIVLIGSVFMVIAISFSGMPPLSGFIGKFMLLHAAFATIGNFIALVISIILITSGLIIIIALARAGSSVFYKTDINKPQLVSPTQPQIKLMIVPILLLSISPLLSLFAGNIYDFTKKTAQNHFNYRLYVNAVFSAQAKPSPNTDGKIPKLAVPLINPKYHQKNDN